MQRLAYDKTLQLKVLGAYTLWQFGTSLLMNSRIQALEGEREILRDMVQENRSESQPDVPRETLSRSINQEVESRMWISRPIRNLFSLIRRDDTGSERQSMEPLGLQIRVVGKLPDFEDEGEDTPGQR